MTDKLKWFNILWALAHITHLLRKGKGEDPVVWLLIFLALVVFDKPRSQLRISVLAAAQLVYLFLEMPITDNHMYIMGFVNIGLVTIFLKNYFNNSWHRLESMQPVISFGAVVILISYSAAALSKLNYDFFNTANSCSVSMFVDAMAIFGGVGSEYYSYIFPIMPFLIAGVEIAIPILLLIPKTRLYGVVMVTVFHFLMSFSPTATALDFTIILISMMVLFLPGEIFERIKIRLEKERISDIKEKIISYKNLLFLLAAFFILSMLMTNLGNVSENRNWLLLFPVAVLSGSLILFLTFSAMRQSMRSTIFKQPGLVESVIFALLLLNITSPYLGFKTAGTFTMYSNLQTSGLESNHFIFGRAPFETRMDDLVKIIDSSDQNLTKMSESDVAISMHELRRELAKKPDASITFSRGDEIIRLDHASQDPHLTRTDPLMHKLVGFRLHQNNDIKCMW